MSSSVNSSVDNCKTPNNTTYQALSWLMVGEFILGLPLNLSVLYVFIFRFKFWKNNSIFLFNIVVADFLLVVCLPVEIHHYQHNLRRSDNRVVCKTMLFMLFLNRGASIAFLITLSLNRYFSVVHLGRKNCVKTFKKSPQISLFIWLLLLPLTIPTMVETFECCNSHGRKVETFYHNVTDTFRERGVWSLRSDTYFTLEASAAWNGSGTVYLRKSTPGESLPRSGFFAVLLAGLTSSLKTSKIIYFSQILFPFFILVYCTCRIVNRLKRKTVGEKAKLRKAMFAVMSVVIVFSVCFLPSTIARAALLVVRLNNWEETELVAVQVYDSLMVLSYTDCLLDPIVYCFCNTGFKDAYISTFCPSFLQKKFLTSDSGVQNTTTTTVTSGAKIACLPMLGKKRLINVSLSC